MSLQIYEATPKNIGLSLLDSVISQSVANFYEWGHN